MIKWSIINSSFSTINLLSWYIFYVSDIEWRVWGVKSLSRVRLFATPWTIAYQASPSMEFSRQEYWNGLPFPTSGDLPDPGIEPVWSGYTLFSLICWYPITFKMLESHWSSFSNSLNPPRPMHILLFFLFLFSHGESPVFLIFRYNVTLRRPSKVLILLMVRLPQSLPLKLFVSLPGCKLCSMLALSIASRA